MLALNDKKQMMWKHTLIPNYFVSPLGAVYSTHKVLPLSMRQINGRNYVNINIYGKICLYRVDYIVAYTFLGMYDDIIRLIHIDGNIANDQLHNLMWYRKKDAVQKYIDQAIIEPDGTIEEAWKECKLDYPCHEKYFISNLGEVRDENGNRVSTKFSHGYEVFFYIDAEYASQTRIQAVHRAVAQAFLPNPENYDMVNHIDGDKSNNVVANLEWVNNGMNAEHAYHQNLHKHARYTDNQIRTACMLLMDPNIPQIQISHMTGIDKKTVSDIRRGRRWSSISKNFTMRERKWNDSLKAEIKQQILDGFKGQQISVNLKIPYEQDFISLYERLRRELRSQGKL